MDTKEWVLDKRQTRAAYMLVVGSLCIDQHRPQDAVVGKVVAEVEKLDLVVSQ